MDSMKIVMIAVVVSMPIGNIALPLANNMDLRECESKVPGDFDTSCNGSFIPSIPLCGAGHKLVNRCVTDASEACASCEPEHYQPYDNICTTCHRCTVCSNRQKMVQTCTADEDTQCEDVEPDLVSPDVTSSPAATAPPRMTTPSIPSTVDGTIVDVGTFEGTSVTEISTVTSQEPSITTPSGGYVSKDGSSVDPVVIALSVVVVILAVLCMILGCCLHHKWNADALRRRYLNHNQADRDIELNSQANRFNGYEPVPRTCLDEPAQPPCPNGLAQHPAQPLCLNGLAQHPAQPPCSNGPAQQPAQPSRPRGPVQQPAQPPCTDGQAAEAMPLPLSPEEPVYATVNKTSPCTCNSEPKSTIFPADDHIDTGASEAMKLTMLPPSATSTSTPSPSPPLPSPPQMLDRSSPLPPQEPLQQPTVTSPPESSSSSSLPPTSLLSSSSSSTHPPPSSAAPLPPEEEPLQQQSVASLPQSSSSSSLSPTKTPSSSSPSLSQPSSQSSSSHPPPSSSLPPSQSQPPQPPQPSSSSSSSPSQSQLPPPPSSPPSSSQSSPSTSASPSVSHQDILNSSDQIRPRNGTKVEEERMEEVGHETKTDGGAGAEEEAFKKGCGSRVTEDIERGAVGGADNLPSVPPGAKPKVKGPDLKPPLIDPDEVVTEQFLDGVTDVVNIELVERISRQLGLRQMDIDNVKLSSSYLSPRAVGFKILLSVREQEGCRLTCRHMLLTMRDCGQKSAADKLIDEFGINMFLEKR